MVVGNGLPVTPGNTKSGRPAGCARGAVDMMDLAFRAAKIVPEWRFFRLGVTQLLLGNGGNLFEVCKGTDVVGLYTGLVPFALVKWRVIVSIGHHFADARNN